jgi:hypothetical protein
LAAFERTRGLVNRNDHEGRDVKVEILDADVVWRDLDGEIVILNLATGYYYGLEGAGNDIWRLLVEHGSTEKVVEVIANEYDVDTERLALDLHSLVQDLARKSIVRVDIGQGLTDHT